MVVDSSVGVTTGVIILKVTIHKYVMQGVNLLYYSTAVVVTE